MFVLLTTLFLFLTALTLLILRWVRPDFRFTWLIATGGSFLAWIGILLWQLRLPSDFTLPSWQPASLFTTPPAFLVNDLTWPYALSLVTLALAVLLTSVVRENFPKSLSWAGMLILTGLGLLAVLANNPFTLVLVWAALDLTELILHLRLADSPNLSERVVIVFFTRVAGSGVLLWANMVSIAAGTPMTFQAILPQAGLYLLIAAGLRLGALPLHLPYTTGSTLRRDFGTILRFVSAASSLALLTRIPPSSLVSPLIPFLMLLAAFTALYSSWIWLRAPDEITGRPFWMLGLAALAVASALNANPAGSVAWGCAMIIVGSTLFLSTIQHRWLTRFILVVGTWGLSTLPFSPTAAGWQGGGINFWLFLPFFIGAQTLILAGFIHHVLRSVGENFKSQPRWAQIVYPIGIGLPLVTYLIIGPWGWRGAPSIDLWPIGLVVVTLAASLVWFMPRSKLLKPPQAHWIRPISNSRIDQFYLILRGIYRLLERLCVIVSNILESDGGIIWTLLFLVLFISLLTQRLSNP